MKLDIVHDITYRYDAPVRSSTQYFRLTPRESPRHRILEWAVDTPVPATRTRDGYGNVLHVLTLDKPVSEIRIRAHGVVETHPSGDAPGDGGDAGLSPLVFRRTTPVTRVDEALAAFADKHRKRAGTLAGLRDLAGAIEDKMPFKPDEVSGAASAAEAFAGGPAAAVFVHPGHRQIQTGCSQGPAQPQPIAPAVERLPCRLLVGVQGQPHHQSLHPPLLHQGLEMEQIPFKRAPQQGRQGGDREAEGITTSQADAALAHIQGQR